MSTTQHMFSWRNKKNILWLPRLTGAKYNDGSEYQPKVIP